MRGLCLAVSVALALSTSIAHTQNYPNRPLRIFVPFAAGGAVDTLARLVGAKLGENLGQPVVVENRAGAGGNLAPDAVAKAPGDGYTILLTTNGLAISPSLYRTLPFDVHKDLIPVTQLVASQLVLTATPKLPTNSVAELIALAKSKPGDLNYGSTGIGNPLHLTMEMLKNAAGIAIQPVPYRGDAPLIAALIAGRNPARRDTDGDHGTAGASRPAQGAGDRRRQALAGTAGRGDDRRDHPRLRVHILAGVLRAGGHAA